jgi:hypothetical protein
MRDLLQSEGSLEGNNAIARASAAGDGPSESFISICSKFSVFEIDWTFYTFVFNNDSYKPAVSHKI